MHRREPAPLSSDLHMHTHTLKMIFRKKGREEEKERQDKGLRIVAGSGDTEKVV